MIHNHTPCTNWNEYIGAATAERRPSNNEPTGEDTEEGYETDEVDSDRRAGSKEGRGSVDLSGSSMQCFRKTATNVVAQMQQILLEPATSDLCVNRITSNSEEIEVQAGSRLEILNKRAKTLKQKAEDALGREVLQVRLSSRHLASDANECVQRTTGQLSNSRNVSF